MIPNTFRNMMIKKWIGPAVILTAAAIIPTIGFSQDATPPAPPPSVQLNPAINLHYRELTNREQLKLKVAGQESVRPVGDLHFAFPPGEFPAAGLEPSLRTFCVEPLVPIFAGETYPFTVDSLNNPKSFGLNDDEAGRKLADRKTLMIRELYGRYYQETIIEPAIAAPAFQTAVWEIFHEQEIPEGPMPLNLFTGTFQVNYPNEVSSPAYVQRAQKYVQSIIGDDTAFLEDNTFAGLEPVRLTGVPTAAGMTAQSQLALRTGPGGGPGIGGSGPLVGAGGGVAPFAGGSNGGGLGGSGLGGAPFFPAAYGGGGGTPTNTLLPPGTSGPQSDQGPGGEGPSQGEEPTNSKPNIPPDQPPPNSPPVDPIPAPPGLVLGAIGLLGLAAVRRFRANKTSPA